MSNPFTYGSCITDPARFVGRHVQLNRIFTTLDTLHTGQLQSASVVGPHRIGRSSLLYHVTQVYRLYLSAPERYLFVYVDLESGRYASQSALLKGILQGLLDALPPAGLNPLRQRLAEVVQSPELSLADFETAVQECQRLPPAPLYPVICLDEFEQLSSYPDVFPDLLYDSWRSLMSANHLALVIASTRPLYELSKAKKLTSNFFNIFSEFVPLAELTGAEAWELINWGRACDRPFSGDDCARAIRLAGHHPYKIQLVGSLIYQAKEGHARPDWPAVQRDFRRIERNVFAGHHPPWYRVYYGLGWALPVSLGRALFLLLHGSAPGDENDYLMLGRFLLLLLVILLAAVFWLPGLAQLLMEAARARLLPTATAVP